MPQAATAYLGQLSTTPQQLLWHQRDFLTTEVAHGRRTMSLINSPGSSGRYYIAIHSGDYHTVRAPIRRPKGLLMLLKVLAADLGRRLFVVWLLSQDS